MTREEVLEKALRDVLAICQDRALFVAQGPRAFARAEQIAKTALAAPLDPWAKLFAEVHSEIGRIDSEGHHADVETAAVIDVLHASAHLIRALRALDRGAGR